MDSIVISIIVPAYNAEKFIIETLNSVINQTYLFWELIVVDDGSTDKTYKIVKDYLHKDDRIKLIKQKNSGQGGARNIGIKKSKGKWIAFLDADDLWVKDKLEKQLEAIEEYKADFVYTMSKHFPRKGHETIEWHCKFTEGSEMFKILYTDNGIVNSSVLVRKELIEEVGGFDESREIQGSEDWDLWLRLAKNDCGFYGVTEKLVLYRIHMEGIHLNSIRMLEGKKTVYCKYKYSQSIPDWVKLKQYRFVCRELFREYTKVKNWREVSSVFEELLSLDRQGLTTIIQSFLFFMFPIKTFSWLSIYLVFRIGYRYEYLRYKLK